MVDYRNLSVLDRIYFTGKAMKYACKLQKEGEREVALGNLIRFKELVYKEKEEDD